MKVDITDPWPKVDITVEGETVDILRLFEETAKTIALVLKDNDDVVLDLTSHAIELAMYNDRRKGTLIHSFDTDDGITITDATLGEINLIVDATDISLSADQFNAYGEISLFSGGSLTGTITDRAILPLELLAVRNS